MEINVHTFDELSPRVLYEILQLRSEIFIVEQNCAYQDLDGKDLYGLHLTMRDEGRLVGYTRLLPMRVSYPEHSSIGRVVIRESYRKNKLGKLLMQASIRECINRFRSAAIKISAQCYLQKFYEGLGFEITGASYLEDDIPHIAMVYSGNKEL